MEEKRAAAASTAVGIEGPSPIPGVALECVLGYADDPRDRATVSLVYRRWHRLDALTRAHVTVAFCYAASPSLLRRHFPRVESLKLKAKPRTAMFNLIPDDWVGHAPTPPRTSTASRPSTSAAWSSTTTPSPSSAPAGTCSGPSASTSAPASPPTPSLLARSCRCLRTLFLEESKIMDHDGEWLWKLAINNSVLETLNFYMTDLRVSLQHLELLARNCRLLVSLKTSDRDVSELAGFFQTVNALQEFGGGSFTEQRNGTNRYHGFNFPQGSPPWRYSSWGQMRCPQYFQSVLQSGGLTCNIPFSALKITAS